MRLYHCLKLTIVFLIVFQAQTIIAQKEPKVIVFSKTAGYRHQSIETGIEALKKLGKDNNFLVDTTEDADELTNNLEKYKVVIFLSTTGDIFNENQQKAFKKYINNGGGFVGIHAATDTEYDWPWYNKLVGAYFKGHPRVQEATLRVLDKDHRRIET